MSLENPRVQVRGAWGHYSDIEIDHNQSPNSAEYWKISLVRRLSFSPKPEVLLADCVAWIAYSTLTSYTLTGISLAVGSTLVLFIPLGVLSSLTLIWVVLVKEQLGEVFLSLITKRVLLVGLGLFCGVWLW